MTRSVARLVAVVAAVVGAVGCGLPDDREPQIITAQDAPLDLARPSAANNSSSGDIEVTLFFVRDGKLVDVTRAVDSQSPTEVVNALLARPTPEEEASGLRSEIPAETSLVDADATDGIATINLGCTTDDEATGALPTNCGIQGAEGTAQLTVFAQLTCTADALPGIDGVVFFQEGVPQDAPTDSGLATGSEPVDCNDYGSVR